MNNQTRQQIQKIQTLEELQLNALPCLQQILYDGWILRFAEGYTKRANSVTPLYPSSQDLLTKIHRCESWYRHWGLRPIFRLADIPLLQSLDRTLASLGYRQQDRVSVQLKTLSDRDPVSSYPKVTIADEISEAWLDDYVHASDLPIQHWNTLSTMLEIIPNPTGYALLKDRYRFGSCALGVLENHYLSLFLITTAKKQRGKGYASQLIAAMLHWGKTQGATKALVQVEINNQPAINLYRKLGFTEVYQYFYRIKPDD